MGWPKGTRPVTAGRVTVSPGPRAPFARIGVAGYLKVGTKLMLQNITVNGDDVVISLKIVKAFKRALTWEDEPADTSATTGGPHDQQHADREP